MLTVPRLVNSVRIDQEKLRDALRASGRSREAIAARAGISIATLFRIMRIGQTSRPYAAAIARAVGRGLRDLIQNEQQESAQAARGGAA
jgi:transcriptional regulator with XRE-family HTH domain